MGSRNKVLLNKNELYEGKTDVYSFSGLTDLSKEIVRVSSLITRENNFNYIVRSLIEQAVDVSKSDLGAFYLLDSENDKMILAFRRGGYTIPQSFDDKDFIEFIYELKELIVLNEKKQNFLYSLFINDRMNSGIAIPIFTPKLNIGMLILNSKNEKFYKKEKIQYIESISKIASGTLHNSKMYKELKEFAQELEELKIYQENIFSSMSNLLITVDSDKKIHYFNEQAAEKFKFTESVLGKTVGDVFRDKIDDKILSVIEESITSGKKILGIEGIYFHRGIHNLEDDKKTRDKNSVGVKNSGAAEDIVGAGENTADNETVPEENDTKFDEMDFSLNISPLLSNRGRLLGLTLVFTDQTSEKELQSQVNIVQEDRRRIKDMFSKYLSKEIVHKLIESPEIIKLGGDKKLATLFFADIRGYTSFSETKTPEYIVEVLNQYFSEVVEIVLQHNGFIDKFIGDCIMAVWGVPMQSEEEDAIQAVTCAIDIQKTINSTKRKFFKGEAEHLKVGIGVHTGPLIAGNIGSSSYMNYTVIGDTVNIAARIEGVTKADEIIITENTKNFVHKHLKLEPRDAVKVKGKVQPIPIYNVPYIQ